MLKIPSKTLIIDVSNILFRVATMQKISNPYANAADPEDLVGLCMHISVMSIYKWFNKYKPDFIVFAFEGKNNWRKVYTKEQFSRLQYKGNRVVDPEMKHYYELINAFRDTMKSHTSICCLSIDGMEADDSIGGFCQLYASDTHEIIIVSGDKDFVQLLKLPQVKLVDPATGKLRNQPGDKGYVENIDYWLFLKCIRGDMGDFVPSAFPRVRETRLKKAFENEYELTNLMNERWVDETGKEHRVGDLYNQNIILLDLYKQPEPQRNLLLEGVKQQTMELGKYNHFHFLRFLDKFKLNKLRDEAQKFVGLFANNQRFLKGEATQESQGQIYKNRSKNIDDSPDAEIIDTTGQTKKLLEF